MFILFLLAACAPKEEVVPVPDDLIGKEKMIEVLTDVHLIEGSRTGLSIMGDTIGLAVYYDRLFKKHSITKEQYDNSFNYYIEFPEELDAMYERVIENLTKMENVPSKN